MNGLVLESVEEERDIGVVVENSLTSSLQCAEAARRATGVLTQITKAFLYRFLGLTKDNIYIDMQAGRNLLPKLPVADN